MPRWKGVLTRPTGQQNYYQVQLAVDRAQRERTLEALLDSLTASAVRLRVALAKIDARRRAEVRNG